MTRYEYIAKGGKQEMAKAIGFCLAIYHETLTKETMSCDDLKAFVNEASEKLESWLDEEVKE